MGPKFLFKHKDAHLAKALRLINEKPLDYDRDALNFLLHGIEPDEGTDFLADLDIDFDFSEWLGGIYVDVTDPDKYLHTEHADMAMKFRHDLKGIASLGSSGLPNFARKFSTQFKMQWDQVVF